MSSSQPSTVTDTINTCSHSDGQCYRRVLTTSKSPYLLCHQHCEHGGEFVFNNDHISILLVSDFEVLARRYSSEKQDELKFEILNYFEKLFQVTKNNNENKEKDLKRIRSSIQGIDGRITDQRRISWIKRGYLYIMDYKRSAKEEAQHLAFKIGHTNRGIQRFDAYRNCDVQGKTDSDDFCYPMAIFPWNNDPRESKANDVVPFIWLFEKIIHCLYREENYNKIVGKFTCTQTSCKSGNHKEVYALPLNGQTRRRAIRFHRKRILSDMSVWKPFLMSLG
ncbi:MAG: hypothetical protein J3R72DRAFT_431187, partial [Linnemannia gamsii]